MTLGSPLMLVLISPSLGFSSLLSHCLLLPALTSSHPCLQWISSPCPQSPKATCTQVLPIDCGLDNSVQFSHSVMSNSLRSHRLQHTRPPCPSPTPGAKGTIAQVLKVTESLTVTMYWLQGPNYLVALPNLLALFPLPK